MGKHTLFLLLAPLGIPQYGILKICNVKNTIFKLNYAFCNKGGFHV